MDGFLTKPISLERLDAVLAEHLWAGPAPARPSQPADEPADQPADQSADQSADQLVEPPARSGVRLPRQSRRSVALDSSRLDELAEMGADALPLIQRAVDNFVARADEQVLALRSAVSAGDGPAVKADAHRLKGSALNLGALRVAELCLALEEAGLAGRFVEGPALLDSLAEALDEATKALRGYRLLSG